MRSKSELVKRYILFTFGLFINALGVALIIVAALGTSPIAVIPYVMNQATGISVGTYTFILNMILLLLQMMILGKRFPTFQFLQIPVSFAFAFFVDISLMFCKMLESSQYGIQFLILILGCVVRALGVSIQVLADVVMLSGEAFVKAISVKYEKDFSRIKLCVDAAMVLIAIGLSYIFMKTIVGVREGSVIAVILIAPCSTLFTRKLYFVEHYLTGKKPAQQEASIEHVNRDRLVVTISSDFGSGGHKIGKMISEALGFQLYDRNLATLVSKECGRTVAFTVSHDEKLYKSWYDELFTEAVSIPGGKMDPYAEIFEAQKKIISNLASENCVIIGHCANYILKDHPDAIHIHIHSDLEHRLKRLTRDYKINQKTALRLINRRDKMLSAYYRHFTGENWKDFDNYTVTIENALLDTEETAEILLNIIEHVRDKIHQQNGLLKDAR